MLSFLNRKKNNTHIYILTYKLKSHYQKWIIKVTDDIEDLEYLEEFIYNVKSFNEKYYLVERAINKDDLSLYLNYKQFHKFKFTKNDKILKESTIYKYFII